MPGHLEVSNTSFRNVCTRQLELFYAVTLLCRLVYVDNMHWDHSQKAIFLGVSLGKPSQEKINVDCAS